MRTPALAALFLFPALVLGDAPARAALASDGKSLFRVGSDGALLSRIASSRGGWAPLPLGDPRPVVEAIAYDSASDALVVLDRVTGTVARYDLRTASLQAPLARYEGDPEHLVGAALAVARDEVFLGVPGEGVFGAVEGKLVRVHELAFERGGGLAGASRQLVVTLPSARKAIVREFVGTGFVDHEVGAAGSAQAFTKKVNSAVTRSLVLGLASWAPGPVTIQGDVVYVGDRATGAIVAFSVSGRQPVPLPPSELAGAVAIAATADDLFVLLEAEAEPVRMLRLVPVLLSAGGRPETAMEMVRFMRHLDRANALPVVEVEWSPELMTSLSAGAPRSLPGSVDVGWVLSALNEGRHASGRPQAGDRVRVPTLAEERFIDAVEVYLKGVTASSELERLVVSRDLSAWRGVDLVANMNPDATEQKGALLAKKEGTITLPIERVRYLTALPANYSQALKALNQDAGVKAFSLESKPSRAEGAPVPFELPWKEQADHLEKGRTKLLETVSWHRTPPAKSSRLVGVVETGIDSTHPALKGVLVPLDPRVKLGPTLDAKDPPVVRARKSDLDHGTMVASLLAASWSPFPNGKGLAQKVKVMWLHADRVDLPDQIVRAKLRGVKIFNVSQTIPVEASGHLQETIEDPYNAGLLFVVAAGNDGKKLDAVGRIPALWGDRPNIITVAATSEDGTRLEQSNWDSARVAIAAPGYGYFAAGESYSYVPVEGTSFATPIVTAVAVELVRAGLPPHLVKQRIVATATYTPALKDQVPAGMLNADLALLDPEEDWVETDATPTRASFDPNLAHKLTFTTRNDEPTIELDRIRRITRNDDGSFRVAYVAGPDEKLLWLEEAVADAGAALVSASGETIPLKGVKAYVRRTNP